MKLYAVIDTNVLVSALLHWDSVPGAVLEQALVGNLVPILNDEIVGEYENVLRRKKFSFQEEDIRIVIDAIRKNPQSYHYFPPLTPACELL